MFNTTAPATSPATQAEDQNLQASTEATSAAQASAEVPAAGAAEAPKHEFQEPIEGAVMVPHGTVAKMGELAKAGDTAAIDAWIKEQPSELQESLRKAFDGSEEVTIQDSDPELAELTEDSFEPFSDEELSKLDPAAAQRIAFLQNQIVQQMEAAEASKGSIPPDVQAALNDPFVRQHIEMLATGKSYTPAEFDMDAIRGLAKASVDSGDIAALGNLLEKVLDAIPDVERGIRGETERVLTEKHQAALQQQQFHDFMERGLELVHSEVPEFKSTSIPETIVRNGVTEINPEHPAGKFAFWLGDMMRQGAITQVALAKFGFKKFAYDYLAEQKGGMGNVVASAVKNGQETLRDKFMRSRNKALGATTAKTLNVPSSGVVRPLLHGVDLELAARDHSYAARVSKGLSDSQKSEVAKRLAEMAGLTSLV